MIWGVGLSFYVFVFMLAVGVSLGISVVVSILSAVAIFFIVLLLGEDARRS
jgi:hypothetical protein